MESVLLDAPEGISARLGWDPKLSVHDRRRFLARELVAAQLGAEYKDVRVDREAPQHFGYHTRLLATRADVELPILIKTASFRSATVVAICDPAIPLGLDIRDTHPDDALLHDMQRHSHLFDENDVPALISHWTKVQAVLEADGRGVRVKPEYVKLDNARHRGWVRDRSVQYTLADLSRDAWVITLAYGAMPV
ncbi:hypothetical protein [Microbacterium sp. P01]|uniref:hypothetical protein n=1 Tax=unclassified Microbacterium TaxID=2609290 RepID=UPI00367104F9